VIEEAPDKVCAVLAEYNEGHLASLPKYVFSFLLLTAARSEAIGEIAFFGQEEEHDG
jgi:hypothetical protein